MKSMWIFIIVMFISLGAIAGGVGMFFGLYRPALDAANILENGVETTANIIRLNSTMAKAESVDDHRRKKRRKTKQGERLYYLELSFRNTKGEEIRYKTGSIYTESFIINQGIASKNEITRKYDIVEKETVQVMYKGNKAVLKDFVPDKDLTRTWFVPLIFGVIGIGFFTVSLFAFMDEITLLKIRKEGVSGTGIYLKNTSDSTKTYNIYFTFENKDGKYVEVETGSIYDESEAEALIEMQSFPIKFIGDKAVIMVDKEELLQFKTKKTLQDQ